MDLSSPDDWARVQFKHNRIFNHKTMCINFTTYDVCRTEDIINPRTQQSDIMILNPEKSMMTTPSEAHPFWYAKVLGIFHTNVVYMGQGNHDLHSRRMEFLWVQWHELKKVGSWIPLQLDEVYFSSILDNNPFGFLDPSDILRVCHIIPCFKMGHIGSENQPEAELLESAQKKYDWKVYYVNW